MKINKWTAGLAAVGLVSLASVAQAEETTTPLLTALSSTVISGYVDVSAVWAPGTGNANPAPVAFNAGKQDGFNLNVVGLTLEKPLDEGSWSAGYKVDLLFGPDAVGFNTSANARTLSSGGFSFDKGTKVAAAGGGGGGGADVEFDSSGSTLSDFGIKQAYVALRAPVGNGLDMKLGVFDTPIGYESYTGYRNPNYTRSYGYTIEPTEHTGLLASYQICDMVAVSAGVANTLSAGINNRSPRAESSKTYMGSVTITAPESMGALAGSALYAGIVNGFGTDEHDNQTSYYVGATVATPVAGLRLGASYDHVSNFGPGSDGDVTTADGGYASAAAVYASFQATEKLSLHARGEYAKGAVGSGFSNAKIFALTGTVQYDLWANVISRLEVRWDHSDTGIFGGTSAGRRDSDPLSASFNPNGAHEKNAVLIAANLIYKF